MKTIITAIVAVNVCMFGVTIVGGAFMIGMLKDKRHIAFVNVAESCDIMVGQRDYLSAMVEMNKK